MGSSSLGSPHDALSEAGEPVFSLLAISTFDGFLSKSRRTDPIPQSPDFFPNDPLGAFPADPLYTDGQAGYPPPFLNLAPVFCFRGNRSTNFRVIVLFRNKESSGTRSASRRFCLSHLTEFFLRTASHADTILL